jgi:hypothetical protein
MFADRAGDMKGELMEFPFFIVFILAFIYAKIREA